MPIENLLILTDEQLVLMAREGSETAEEILIEKYKGLVRTKSKAYFIAGAEAEDVVQEGMIGLMKAVRSFDADREASFKTYASTCINNQIIKPKGNQIEVRTGHVVTDESGVQRQYELSLFEESLGTVQLFHFAPFLRKALETGKVLFIDEIDRSLHPSLIKLLVNLFRDVRINTKGAQLIFNTHETALLSLGTFRRDQIYFTEKNPETGGQRSSIPALARKDVSIRRAAEIRFRRTPC